MTIIVHGGTSFVHGGTLFSSSFDDFLIFLEIRQIWEQSLIRPVWALLEFLQLLVLLELLVLLVFLELLVLLERHDDHLLSQFHHREIRSEELDRHAVLLLHAGLVIFVLDLHAGFENVPVRDLNAVNLLFLLRHPFLLNPLTFLLLLPEEGKLCNI